MTSKSDQQVKDCQMLMCLSDLSWACQTRPVTQRDYTDSHKSKGAHGTAEVLSDLPGCSVMSQDSHIMSLVP